MKIAARIKRILIVTALIIFALSTAAFGKTTVTNKKLTLSFGAVKSVSAGSKSKWKSSKSSVIKVKAASTGKKATLTAAGVGTAKVTATFTNKKKKIIWTITVKASNTSSSSGSGSNPGSGTSTGGSGSSSGSTTLSPNDTAGMTATEASLYKQMLNMRSKYPEGMSWTNSHWETFSGGIVGGGYGCAAFTFKMSDTIFGSARARGIQVVQGRSNVYSVINQIKVGDILRIDNRVINGVDHDIYEYTNAKFPYIGAHQVIVLKVKSSSVIVAEGNYNGQVHWGREIKFSELAASRGENALMYILTRY